MMENDLFDDIGEDEEDENNMNDAHPQEDGGISATRSSTPILEIAGKKREASSLALQGDGGTGLQNEYMDIDTTNNINYNEDLYSFDNLYDDPGIDDEALVALEMEASSQYFPGPDEPVALPSSARNARVAAATTVQYPIPTVATKDTTPRPHRQQVQEETNHAAMNMNLSVGLTASQKDHLSNQGPFIIPLTS